MLNKNERDGKLDQAKGKVKQAVGNLTGNERLENEGEVDEAKGKVEEKVGNVRHAVGDAVKDAGNAIKR